MGCDIHLHVEHRKAGRWTHVCPASHNSGSPWYAERNYIMFSVLAGVRDNGSGLPMIDILRGIPGDADPVYREDCEMWSDDAHSHSWATIAELHAHADEYQAVARVFHDSETFAAMLGTLSDIFEDMKDVRVLFFFDN